MHIAFRADASLAIGKGHIKRCLTLAEMFVASEKVRGVEVKITFFTTPHSGHITNEIVSAGFEVCYLPSPKAHIDIENTQTWLGHSQHEDAINCINKIISSKQRFDWLIVDHYTLNYEWHQQLRPFTQNLMVIDDLANRIHDCDLLLDQTLARHASDYKPHTPKYCQLLLGEKYTLLRNEFPLHRVQAQEKRASITDLNQCHILVSIGGFDADNVSDKVVNALIILKQTKPNITASIVLSSQSPHLASIQDKIGAYQWILLEIDCQNMAEIMINADIGIGASGSTAWERACLGLPTISIEIADNQKFVSAALEKQGAIINLGNHKKLSEKKIVSALDEIINNKNLTLYHNMVKQCFTCCDGLGADRVYQAMSACTFSVRAASETDRDIIFSWQSNSQIRKYFRHPQPVEYAKHIQWYDMAIKSNQYHLFIIQHAKLPVGMVRLDESDENTLEISILIDPLMQGKGYAIRALEQIKNMYYQREITAYVHQENTASHKLFKRAQFIKESPTAYRLMPNVTKVVNS